MMQQKRYPTLKDEALLSKTLQDYLTKVQVSTSFVPLSLLMDLVRLQNMELSPAAAIVGGFLGQEILKVLSRKEVPFNNFFCHDSINSTGFLMTIQ
jgi:ubiquitin-like 1-activating enzyme E1 A